MDCFPLHAVTSRGCCVPHISVFMLNVWGRVFLFSELLIFFEFIFEDGSGTEKHRDYEGDFRTSCLTLEDQQCPLVDKLCRDKSSYSLQSRGTNRNCSSP